MMADKIDKLANRLYSLCLEGKIDSQTYQHLKSELLAIKTSPSGAADLLDRPLLFLIAFLGLALAGAVGSLIGYSMIGFAIGYIQEHGLAEVIRTPYFLPYVAVVSILGANIFTRMPFAQEKERLGSPHMLSFVPNIVITSSALAGCLAGFSCFSVLISSESFRLSALLFREEFQSAATRGLLNMGSIGALVGLIIGLFPGALIARRKWR